jgi:competence protein ComEC
MQMFLILILFSVAPMLPSAPDSLASLSQSLQRNCAASVPNEMKFKNLSQSFLCGTKISDSQAKEVFQETSLLHLMVVSGSHLQILCFFLLLPWPLKWREKKFLKFSMGFIFIFYCLMTGFQAPLVRALVARGLASLNEHWKLHWDGGKVQLYSGLLVLALIPEWILSFSFYLSWLASVGFLFTPMIRKQDQFSFLLSFLNCFFIQALMSLFFQQFSVLGFLVNALAAPVIAFCLFPTSFLPILFPQLSPLSDWVWDLILRFLKFLSELSSSQINFEFDSTAMHWYWLWILITLIHCSLEVLQRWRYQKSHV